MIENSIISNNLNLCQCGCGTIITGWNRHKKRFMKFIRGHHSKGENNPAWKGGRRKFRGYWLIWKPDHYFAHCDGYVFEHRYIWEQMNKSCLLPFAEVHHINKIKTDNRPENLQVMTKSYHITHHLKGNKRAIKDMSGRVCLKCNSNTTTLRKGTKGGNPYFRWHKYENGFLCAKCGAKEEYKRRMEKIIS